MSYEYFITCQGGGDKGNHLVRGRWEGENVRVRRNVSTYMNLPVCMNDFTYLCVWMASGQTELGLMDCIYRE